MKITRKTTRVWAVLVIATFASWDCIVRPTGNSTCTAVEQQGESDATLRDSRSENAQPVQEFLNTLKEDLVTQRDEAAIRLLRDHVEMVHVVLDELHGAPEATRNHALQAFLIAIPFLNDDRENQECAIRLLRPFILSFIPTAIQNARACASGRSDGNAQARDISAEDISRGMRAERLGVLVGYSKPTEDSLASVISVFRELVQNETAHVRGRALIGVYKSEHLGEPRVARALIPDLLGVVEDNSQPEDVRKFACLVFGALGPDAKEAVPALMDVIDAPGFGWVAECALSLIAPDVLEKSGKGKLPIRVRERYSTMIGGPSFRKQFPEKAVGK